MTGFMGGFLALAGSQSDRTGLTSAGEYTAATALVFLPVGLYLLLTSGAKAEQHPRYGPRGAVITF